MLLESESWHLGYSQIVQDCRSASRARGTSLSDENCYLSPAGSVLILCNPDTDALCAARILSYAFRADGVSYQLRPCGGCCRLVKILSQLSRNDPRKNPLHHDNSGECFNLEQNTISINNVRAIVLLNLGATKNLSKLLFSPTHIMRKCPTVELLAEESQIKQDQFMGSFLSPELIKIHVLDSHRPYHLANVHAGVNIVLWNDFSQWHNDPDVGGLPSDGDGLSGNEEDTEEENNSGTHRGDSSVEDEINNDTMIEYETNTGSDWQKNEDNIRKDVLKHFINDNSVDGSYREEYNEKATSKKCRKRLNMLNLEKKLKQEFSHSTNKVDIFGNNNLKNYVKRCKIRKNSKVKSDNDAYNNKISTKKGSYSRPVILINNTSDVNYLSKSEKRKDRRNRIRLYYTTGTFHSSPVSFVTYTLVSTQLRFDNVGDLLWLACIGITDAYIHNRLDVGGYALFSVELRRHVNRVYPSKNASSYPSKKNINTFNPQICYLNEKGTILEESPALQSSIGHTENGRILFQNSEFRFFLLRHTSLWEAMTLSPHLCTTMELWRPTGERRLKEMLAKMGIPITQCRQPYAFMKPGLKRRLYDMVLSHADEYGLSNITYTGFTRIIGYKSLLSAADMSLAVTALLECYTSTITISKRKKSRQDYKKYEKNMEIPRVLYEENEDFDFIRSFNVAYDTLNPSLQSLRTISSIECLEMRNSSQVEGLDLSNPVNGGLNHQSYGLGAGIQLAIHLQRIIINTAITLVERNAIIRLSHFRYAYLHCRDHGSDVPLSSESTYISTVDQKSKFSLSKCDDKNYNLYHIFSNPLALTKLAYFLMDMHRTNNKWTGTRARPLVLMAEKPQAASYVIIGFEYPEEKGNFTKNRFGQNFELASKTMRGCFKFDSFDSNVIEVKANDVQRFIEHLHYMMDSV